MVQSVWSQLTFSRLSLEQWREASLIHRLLGPLRQWRQSSWLLQWADWIGLGLVGLIFMLAPFVSTTLIGLLLLACGAYWLLLTLTDETQGGLTPIHLMVAAYWGAMLAATAFSPVRSAAVVGLIKLTLNLLLFLLMARILRRPRARNWLITLYLLTALVVSIYGLRQWFFGADALATWVDPTSTMARTTRVYSYLGNPNLLAGYLIPAVMLSGCALFAWRGWGQKALALVMVLVNTACLILTFSRGGWIGFVVAGFFLLVLLVYWWSVRFNSFWRIWALPALIGVSAVVMLGAVLFFPPVSDRIASIFAGRADSSNNFRMNVWAAVLKMIQDRPILGIGPGNEAFNRVYPLYQQPRYTALSAYSIFLETTVEAGFIGLACFLWLMVVTFHHGLTAIRRLRDSWDIQAYWLMGALATQVGMLAHGLVDTIWYRPQVSTLWWLVIALVASYYSSLGWKFSHSLSSIRQS